MKIAFIYNGTENLGIEYLSSFLKEKGHEVSLFFDPAVFSGDVFIFNDYLSGLFNIDNKIVSSVLSLEPDLIAFSVYTGNYQWCLGLAREIKKKANIPIVFGGIHATAVPKRVLENNYVDFVIQGEGEHAMLDLVEGISSGRSKEALIDIANLCFQFDEKVIINEPRPYVQDLDSLPFPDKSLFFSKEPLFINNPYMVMTSRGCPYACTFCSNDMLQTLYAEERRHIRRRSPDNVIAELEQAKRLFKIRSVSFIDDVFTISRPWLEKFFEKYRTAVNLPFYCNIHPLAFTREVAHILKEGGCRLVIMGVQSGSKRIRREIFFRRETNEHIVKAMDYARQEKLKINIDYIFGAPGEDVADLDKSLELCKRIKPDMIQSFWLTYYPGTHIISLAKDKGILSDSDIKKIEEGNIGFTHDVGSVDYKRVPLYKKYELLFELVTIVHGERTLKFIEHNAKLIPFKKMLSMLIYTFNGIRYLRPWVLNKFRYALSRHKAP